MQSSCQSSSQLVFYAITVPNRHRLPQPHAGTGPNIARGSKPVGFFMQEPCPRQVGHSQHRRFQAFHQQYSAEYKAPNLRNRLYLGAAKPIPARLPLPPLARSCLIVLHLANIICFKCLNSVFCNLVARFCLLWLALATTAQ